MLTLNYYVSFIPKCLDCMNLSMNLKNSLFYHAFLKYFYVSSFLVSGCRTFQRWIARVPRWRGCHENCNVWRQQSKIHTFQNYRHPFFFKCFVKYSKVSFGTIGFSQFVQRFRWEKRGIYVDRLHSLKYQPAWYFQGVEKRFLGNKCVNLCHLLVCGRL